VKIFLGILSFPILSRWPNQLILCPFIHFTIFSPLREAGHPPLSNAICGSVPPAPPSRHVNSL
jgi:hypothetical protein